jgi:hypothetical protein
MTPRDPWSVAAEREAARINARFYRRLAELERRPKTAALSPEFVRAANRLSELRPVRVGLTMALKRGKRAYITTVNGIPVAYTQEGWFTQEQVDAKIASQAARTKPSKMSRPPSAVPGIPPPLKRVK